MLGFSPLSSAPLGALEDTGAGSVAAAIAWTEAPDVFAIGATAGSVVAASISWTEAPDLFVMTASGPTAGTVAIGWTEAADAFFMAMLLDAPSYVRAPAGDGYHPRANAHQNRPPALQGYYE